MLGSELFLASSEKVWVMSQHFWTNQMCQGVVYRSLFRGSSIKFCLLTCVMICVFNTYLGV